MAVSLGSTQNVVVTPAKTISLSEVNVNRWSDNPSTKKVTAFIKELNNPVVLWEGEAYDTIGDWTTAQANARLVEIINAM